jgi:HEAT repeat protein
MCTLRCLLSPPKLGLEVVMIRDRLTRVIIFSLGTVVAAICSPPKAYGVTGEAKAWSMFEAAAVSKSATQRQIGIRALGLLSDDARGRELAEHALNDPNPTVRAAAAAALGQMHATESIPKLQKMLKDPRIAVVMAAAHSLLDLNDKRTANAIYLDVLTGERKGDGLIAEQMDTLHDPKELARIGVEQGIGYVPFAGIGWDAWRYTHKKNPHPVRAVAATVLAHDPDPATGRALVKAALNDKDWIVRAAALEALALRGDSALEGKIEMSLFDLNAHVRFTAAAVVIRLSGLGPGVHHDIEKKTAQRKEPAHADLELPGSR